MGQARGAGLRHGYIRTNDGAYHDVDAIINLEGEYDVPTTDVEGDDQLLAQFSSLPTLSLSVTANSMNPGLLATLQGEAVEEITTEGKAGQEVGLGGDGHANPPVVELGGFTVGRLKANDKAQTIKRIFHKVQLRLVSAPQEKDSEFSSSFEGIAFPTTVDVTGTELPTRRVETAGYTEQSIDDIIAEQESFTPEA